MADVLIRCTRCQCRVTLAQDDRRLQFVDEHGYNLPFDRSKVYCPCFCHYEREAKPLPKLVAKVLDFGDETPF